MPAQPPTIRFAIPKGRMYDAAVALLAEAGVRVAASSRDYRPSVSLPGFDTKILKPRAIIEMLDAGARDLGFAGADWVAEDGADLVELLDTGLDSVRLVAAAPESILEGGQLPGRPLIVATEYVSLAERWIADRGLDARVLRSFGATEVLPPEDADCIIDNTATGSTLTANALRIVDELATSTTRLYASRAAMDDARKRDGIARFVMLTRSVLEARRRAIVELNVPADKLDAVVEVLPCMREPTVSPLRGSGGYAVKAAVPRDELASVIPAIKARGGTDILVTRPQQIVL
ncbi:MAG: ATP phosphoribosyltransferase [Phycisphaeraceae bacterium]|nr:MAG: ATP phosphoribosyltransferase [Phycisphaeraceae bacterium]